MLDPLDATPQAAQLGLICRQPAPENGLGADSRNPGKIADSSCEHKRANLFYKQILKTSMKERILAHNAQMAEREAAPTQPAEKPKDRPTGTKLLEAVLESLEKEKAENIIPIDLRGKSVLADHMVIASGRSARQVGAISEKLIERLKTGMGVSSRVEGKEKGDWVLIDSGDVVTHVFRPEVREFYQLEKLWMPLETASPE